MFGIGAAIKAVVALLIVSLLLAAGWYITGLRADLAVREANEQKLKDGIAEQQRLMDRMRADVAAIQKINQELNTTMKRQADDMASLTKKFSQDARGNPRDFGEFAAERPELVEKLVNRGTRNAYRCMEIASGSPHTAEELAATTRDTINRECPAIANPNYRAGVDVNAMAKSDAAPEPKKDTPAVLTTPTVTTAPAANKPAPPNRPPPPVRPPPPGDRK